jgi:hypothetical protein
MKPIYKSTIIDELDLVIADAKASNKTIKCIWLSPEEWQELMDLVPMIPLGARNYLKQQPTGLYKNIELRKDDGRTYH